MAETSREIKRRIASITNTQQITKAMEMIAAAKLRKIQQMVVSTRPYYRQLKKNLNLALEAYAEIEKDFSTGSLSALTRPAGGDRYCLLVLTSDRGLAGGYNAAIIRGAEAFLKEHPDTEMVIVGRKARDHFRRRGQTFLAEFVNIGDDPTLSQGRRIGQVIFDFYVHGLFDRVAILYTKFINTVTHRVTLRPVFPAAREKPQGSGQTEGFSSLYLFEPSVEKVLESLVPLYVQAVVYQSLVEAKASEFGARMSAMRSATDNAGELIQELNLTYNRARQAQITKEIAEIVGGADALQL